MWRKKLNTEHFKFPGVSSRVKFFFRFTYERLSDRKVSRSRITISFLRQWKTLAIFMLYFSRHKLKSEERKKVAKIASSIKYISQ